MSRHKKHKKSKRKFSVFLYLVLGLIAVWLVVGIFVYAPAGIFFNNAQKTASVYVYPKKPKQGDTVFIKVKSQASDITGNFENEKIVFYKANSQEWIGFLGIDADQNPGDYKVSVDTSKTEHLTNDITVALADFSTAATVTAPSSQKTGITTIKALDNIRKSDNPALSKVLDNPTLQPYFTSPFSFPLSAMQKTGFSFGKFIGFAKDKTQHLGVDLRALENTSVYSVNEGRVVATLNLSNYGKTVIIDHGLDIFSMYLHLEEFKVFEGQIVKKGQIIGLSGDTGYVTAPHLHFSMRVGGARVDPIAFIETTQQMNNNSFLASIGNAILNIFNQK